MERFSNWHITAVVALALLHSTGARAQLMIQTRCDAAQSRCIILVGPPDRNAGTVSVPVVIGNQGQPAAGAQAQQLYCTQIAEQQTWPSRPSMRQCKLWQ
jgi:hypothetical protein